MRDFYRGIISNLYIYCGNRQAEKMEDDDITVLLNLLENVSKRFSYIPEEEQKKIILQCLETDTTYQNINVRLISNWLMLNGKKWFKEEAHQEREEIEGEIVTGEARDKWIQTYLETVAKVEVETNPGKTQEYKGGGTRLRENIGIKKFVVDGMEIYAHTLEEATEQRKQILNP